jgi:hypothetical protein
MAEVNKADWVASLFIPGWSQIMLFAPVSAVVFFLSAIAAWIFAGWPYALAPHLGAAVHAATLIADHFNGKRQATADAAAQRLGLNQRP